MRSRWRDFQILLMSGVEICIENILHGNEIIQYLKNYKSYKIHQDHSREHLQSCIRHIQFIGHNAVYLFVKGR